jgi:4-amino-4-deoxy-L-arabinose transferase-like glycosyltransferase
MFEQIVTATTSAATALGRWAGASCLRASLLVVLVASMAFLPGFASMPPTDRDEGRYVMATKQMMETGDYIDIRNQDQPRYKQPAGIYWLQATAAQVFGDGAASPIGIYRLPSLTGAVLAGLLTVWAFLPLAGRQAALLGALLLSGTILLGVEARIAKTDAVLLATTLLALGVLLRARLDPAALRASRLRWLFWVALGVSAMIKGPITLLVVLAAAIALSVQARSPRWLLALQPGAGILVTLGLALPWYIAIAIVSDGAFFATALGWNALGKVTEVHQGHGGPPGFYLALLWFTFWPASPFLLASLGWIWAARGRREVQMLLCLIIPIWIIFEIVATKLPHYVLPTYPALAVLVALALLDMQGMVRGWWSRLAAQGFWVLPAILGVAGVGAFIWFEGRVPWIGAILMILATAIGVLATAVSHRSAAAAVPVAVGAALVAWLGTYPMLAQANTIWLSRSMAEAARSLAHCANPQMASAGYREPSLVFLTRTDTLLTDGDIAADFLAEGGCRLAFVDAAPGRRGRPSEETTFLARLAETGHRAEQLGMVEGRNMNGGRPRRMGVWRLAP